MLADIADFILGKNQEYQELYGKKFPWVIIGGSYAGALSAWFKAKFPDLVEVAWSSSGVIQPIQFFEQNDRDVYEVLSKEGPQCADKVTEILNYIDEVLDSSQENINLFMS